MYMNPDSLRIDTPARRIGIFGGSFNPPHTGHIALARLLLQQARLDDIFFLVTPLNPFKQHATDLLDDDLRFRLTRMALADEPHLHASNYEFTLPKPSYMWNTLRHLSAAHPHATFVLLIGADNWTAFDRWARHDYIMAHYPIVVYPRVGYDLDADAMPVGVTLADTPLFTVSSTEIRRRVKAGESVEGLVPTAIIGDVIRYYR